MSATTNTPEWVTFNRLHLPEVLPVPDGVLADYVPDHGTALRQRIGEAMQAPLDRLLRAEGFVVPVHPNGVALDRAKRGVEDKIDLTREAHLFIGYSWMTTDALNARYILGTAYHNLRNYVGMAGTVKHWRAEKIARAERTMSAELVTDRSSWGWWLSAMTDYEKRKLDYLKKR